ATQMLYDFGKIKTNVNVEEARLAEQQARVLVSLDQVAFEVADAIVNIKRYQEITKIAQQQIQGIARIAEIANLRARAGISSQADPIQ
ncbi:RND transporter, partial [Yersinia pestis]